MPKLREKPRKGDHYQVRTAFTAHVLTQWFAPFTDGYERTLPVGLRFAVMLDPPGAATAVGAQPEPYDYWEQVLVEPEDRASSKYAGYSIVIWFDALEEYCDKLR